MIKKITLFAVSAIVMLGCGGADRTVVKSELRAPVYPLVSIDPYTSGWSYTDNLYDDVIRHWTGRELPLLGVIKVDDKLYRFMGTENIPMDVIAPMAEQGGWVGQYTLEKPADNWMKPDFNDSKWLTGEAAFGTTNELTPKTLWNMETANVKATTAITPQNRNTIDAKVASAAGTMVKTPYIWARRTVDLDQDIAGRKVYLQYSHDDDVIIYVNGIQVVNSGPKTGQEVTVRLEGEALASLKQGKNVIAAWCWNSGGNGLLDFGLVMEKEGMDVFATTAVQKSVDVQATQTHYAFTCGEVDLNLTFMAPLFLDNLELVSRPVNYITYDVASNDGKEHNVEIYFEASPNWALNTPYQESASEGMVSGSLSVVRTGSLEQPILAKRGDDIRIDWGYFYMAADKSNSLTGVGTTEALRSAFAKEGKDQLVNDKTNGAYMAVVTELGATKKATGKLMLGYDDIYSIQYFGENLRPYWNREGNKTILEQFDLANQEYAALTDRAYKFDRQLMEEATKAGGVKYAELCALAYRQAIHAHKLVQAPNGELLWLSKENNSNGSIGTVDVTYPSAPLFLYYNNDLTKGLLNFIFYYSESGKWAKPFPAHDLGTYPQANGQTYGGDMPVEEAGNMVILTAAVTRVDANGTYAEKHWESLTKWTDYLVEYGLDPENQLCTDDFAGHFAHNVNLSAKAIMGVASYAYMADVLGKKEQAETYRAKAKEMAAWWVEKAKDGDHYRLTFDREGTWSQKYNLVWDKVMNYDIFPTEVVDTEIAYYLKSQNKYGLPLDNRETYTKTDWIIWTATMADDQATFEKFVEPVWLFMNETESRVPMSDWVYTDKPFNRGFKARSVVGGYWIKMLDQKLNAGR